MSFLYARGLYLIAAIVFGVIEGFVSAFKNSLKSYGCLKSDLK